MVYKGRCHCGAVRFEVRTELEDLVRCNCSLCARRSTIMHYVAPSEFTLIRVTSSPTLTCPSTITPRPMRCGCGCSPSSIGSTPKDQASKARPGSHMTTFLVDYALPA